MWFLNNAANYLAVYLFDTHKCTYISSDEYILLTNYIYIILIGNFVSVCVY